MEDFRCWLNIHCFRLQGADIAWKISVSWLQVEGPSHDKRTSASCLSMCGCVSSRTPGSDQICFPVGRTCFHPRSIRHCADHSASTWITMSLSLETFSLSKTHALHWLLDSFADTRRMGCFSTDRNNLITMQHERLHIIWTIVERQRRSMRLSRYPSHK